MSVGEGLIVHQAFANTAERTLALPTLPIMADRITITSAHFRNFKALADFSVSLREMNVLVGPNNCGKSTILSGFRVLAAGLRKANSRKPEIIQGPDGLRYGYKIFEDNIPISIENVHTNYSDSDTTIRFRLSNRNELLLYFPTSGGCCLIPETTGRRISTVSGFRTAFPIGIGIVPVLGPVEHKEKLLAEETVRRDLYTHRASRHFRSYWLHNPEGFADFAELVRKTWRDMDISPPGRADRFSDELVMFCEEKRISRELFWSGFGFQVWCQLLTHIVRSSTQTLLVVDEPEIYLHPDVQRQLLTILRSAGPDIIIATHSTEIMSEADPSEILLVDKSKKSAPRLRDVNEVQAALELIGSAQNITLTQLARTRKVLFVEGPNDFPLIRRFAQRLGFYELAAGLDLTPVESDGASSWERIRDVAWGIEKTLGSKLNIGAVFDRDFRCIEEINLVKEELEKHLTFTHIHTRKEIENFLLTPQALERAINKAIHERSLRTEQPSAPSEPIDTILERITSTLKEETQGQYVAKWSAFFRTSKKDPATLTIDAIRWFEKRWRSLNSRLEIVPGKKVLRLLREEVQRNYSVSLTDQKIIDGQHLDDVPEEMRHLLERLEEFRKSN